ncbi:hypothetical protein [Enhygromyxa salina]|nr:hypothetical protein [Enhygromyxa salina]
MTVDDILRAYEREELDFEDARDQIHSLDPAVMAEVLDVLRDPAREQAHPVAVMALADVNYPPAFEHLRTLLDPEEDPEQLGIPAAIALDSLAGGRFDAERLYSDWEGMAEIFAAIAAWWDSGAAEVPTVDAWLAEKRAKAASLRDQRPPPQPGAGAAEHAALRPALVAMVADFGALPSARKHRLDHDALRRVLHIYTAWAPDDDGLPRALECVRRYLDGEASVEELEQAAELAKAATSSANTAAGWNSHHNAYMDPSAKAAACVAQGVVYAASSEDRNRQQGLNYARDAVEWSGGDIRAELTWQYLQFRDDPPIPAGPGSSPPGDAHQQASTAGTKDAADEHSRGLIASMGILVGVGCLLVAALSVVNTAFDLNLSLGVRGATPTPLPSEYWTCAAIGVMGLVFIGLSLFGSLVASKVREAKGKPLVRAGIVVGALALLAIVGRGVQVAVLMNTYGSMLAYYCTDGDLDDVRAELEKGPSDEDLERALSRTSQYDNHEALALVLEAGADMRSECELLGVSPRYIQVALDHGVGPESCGDSEALIWEVIQQGGRDDALTAETVTLLMAAGWSTTARREGDSRSPVELASEQGLTATQSVLEGQSEGPR